MVLMHATARQGLEHRYAAAREPERSAPIVERLMAEIDHLSRERDSLRKVLIDAGFSLRAERIARYAEEVSGHS